LWSVVSGQLFLVCGQLLVVYSQLFLVLDQLSVIHDQLFLVHGQRDFDSLTFYKKTRVNPGSLRDYYLLLPEF
jgi:hypothetical protein